LARHHDAEHAQGASLAGRQADEHELRQPPFALRSAVRHLHAVRRGRERGLRPRRLRRPGDADDRPAARPPVPRGTDGTSIARIRPPDRRIVDRAGGSMRRIALPALLTLALAAPAVAATTVPDLGKFVPADAVVYLTADNLDAVQGAAGSFLENVMPGAGQIADGMLLGRVPAIEAVDRSRPVAMWMLAS